MKTAKTESQEESGDSCDDESSEEEQPTAIDVLEVLIQKIQKKTTREIEFEKQHLKAKTTCNYQVSGSYHEDESYLTEASEG
eukprot:2419340-Amphidinium_carterae.1